MAIRNLKEQISRLPEQPGVYLYSNAQGETIYVGKARALRDRVRSYLGAYGTSPRLDALLEEIASLAVIVTDSVVEALALENNLIKQRSPKYNIRLRDDSNYPYLQLTTSEATPRVLVARHVARDGDFYAGPFLPAKLARRTMSLTHRLFGIRSCNEIITGKRGRPCLEYDIKRCLAPCVDTICAPERYALAVADTRLFLEGRNQELADQLHGRMMEAASAERFEEAAELRDAMRTVQVVRERQQKMATAGLNDRDVFGVRVGAEGAVIQVFIFRGGRVIERLELLADAGASETEVLGAAVQQFYAEQVPPPEIHVPVAPADADVLEAWLATRAGRRVRITTPQRGEKREMVELVQRNAALAYRTRFDRAGLPQYDALETLKAALKLPALPRRIECFDISTIQGSETVASMVVCEDGRMKRGEYRKFRVGTRQSEPAGIRHTAHGIRQTAHGPKTSDGSWQGADSPRGAEVPSSHDRAITVADPTLPVANRFLDDFAAMRMVVTRRYSRVLEEGGPFPDLVVIDGGKGQLNAAYEGLQAVGLSNLMAVGLAKKEELVFTRDRLEPLALDSHGTALRLLQRIRDEGHRFAVTFHRKARTMRDLRSEIDSVPGIGPRRRKALLTTFGSVAGVRRATREELTTVVGAKAADAVLAHFAHTA
ncbi:MAG: excinuclease ABC subunit UvrC [Vicinamibacterales bacterium]